MKATIYENMKRHPFVKAITWTVLSLAVAPLVLVSGCATAAVATCLVAAGSGHEPVPAPVPQTVVVAHQYQLRGATAEQLMEAATGTGPVPDWFTQEEAATVESLRLFFAQRAK